MNPLKRDCDEYRPRILIVGDAMVDEWITVDKVKEAMKAIPGVSPEIAFKAHFITEIGRYAIQHSAATKNGNGQVVRPLPQGTVGGQGAGASLKAGDDFGVIVAGQATL